jgi:hypothetical protein
MQATSYALGFGERVSFFSAGQLVPVMGQELFRLRAVYK